MILLNGYLLYDIIGIVVALIASLIVYYKWSFTYWKRRGVSTPFPPSIPLGNVSDLVMKKCSYGEQFKNLYGKLKGDGQKHGGVYMFSTPMYIPLDPQIIKHIMQKDFQHFVNRGVYHNPKSDPLSTHLLTMEDELWRNWRIKLTPTFTSGKMKLMMDTMVNTTPELKNIIDDYATTNSPLNIKEIFARFTTDIIGTCAFGIECNSLKNPNSEFRRHGKLAIDEITFEDQLKFLVQFFLPHSILRFFKMRLTKNAVEKFFLSVVEETVRYREKNNIYRKDFMHLLLQLKNRGKVYDDEIIKNDEEVEAHMTVKELAAQCFLFFLAGFETSSTTSTFALYELAKNQDVQDILRKEIRDVFKKYDGKMTYESLVEMTYLEKVIQESLRKYPPIPVLTRICNKEYKVPEIDLVLEKGTWVQIPIMGVQRDPEYYPEPDKFDPLRFTEENIKSRPQFTYLPFGDGPRVCIGLRFGMMQSKVGIATIIKDHKITLNKKTKDPLKLISDGVITTADGGIWLDVQKIPS